MGRANLEGQGGVQKLLPLQDQQDQTQCEFWAPTTIQHTQRLKLAASQHGAPPEHAHTPPSFQCRLCGELICPSCTTRYEIPSKFKLKGKKGPARVCSMCKSVRFRTFMLLSCHNLPHTHTITPAPLLRAHCTASATRAGKARKEEQGQRGATIRAST